jgi:hypothetical protein
MSGAQMALVDHGTNASERSTYPFESKEWRAGILPPPRLKYLLAETYSP